MNKEKAIANYMEFVDRKREVGFDLRSINLMAFAYLDALCECGILEYTEHSKYMRYASDGEVV